MERLTKRNEYGRLCAADGVSTEEILERLEAYEYTGLMPEEVAKRQDEMITAYDLDYQPYLVEATGSAAKHIIELRIAEDEGRLVVLPCKVGDTVYQLRNKKHAKGVGIAPRIVSSACVWSDGSYALCHQGMSYCQSRDLGKTWFLTRKEAEAALEGGEADG